MSPTCSINLDPKAGAHRTIVKEPDGHRIHTLLDRKVALRAALRVRAKQLRRDGAVTAWHAGVDDVLSKMSITWRIEGSREGKAR